MKHLIEPLLEKYTDKDVRNVLEKCIVFNKEEMRQIPELRKQREFVYFLIAKNEIKYIGQTKQIEYRIHTHKKNKLKFDYAIFCTTKPKFNLRVEAFFISKIVPEWNGIIPKVKTVDPNSCVFKFEPYLICNDEIEFTKSVLNEAQKHPRNKFTYLIDTCNDVIATAMDKQSIPSDSVDILQKAIIRYEQLAREYRNEAIRLTKHIKLFKSQIELIEQHIIK
jgi:hypothetical protein